MSEMPDAAAPIADAVGDAVESGVNDTVAAAVGAAAGGTVASPAATQVAAGWQNGVHNLGLIVVHTHAAEEGWYLSASHGEPPKGFYATEADAQKAADRHARAQLERTLSLLTAAEDNPNGANPLCCGLVLLYRGESVSDQRKKVLAALTEVS